MTPELQTRLTFCWQTSRALQAVGDIALVGSSTDTLSQVRSEDLHCLMRVMGETIERTIAEIEELLSRPA